MRKIVFSIFFLFITFAFVESSYSACITVSDGSPLSYWVNLYSETQENYSYYNSLIPTDFCYVGSGSNSPTFQGLFYFSQVNQSGAMRLVQYHVSQWQNGSWVEVQPVSAYGTYAYYSASAAWPPEGWQLGAPTQPPFSCSAGEASFLATCPFNQGTYNCFEPSASVCALQTCDDVSQYVLDNMSSLCPGNNNIAKYTCSEGTPLQISSILCEDCSVNQTSWANINCGGVQYLDTFDCSTNTGTCKECADKVALYGQANCGSSNYVNVFSCENNEFTCFSCEQKRAYESLEHCHGSENYSSFNCQTNEITCDCFKMSETWANNNCGGFSFLNSFNCSQYTGTCKSQSSSIPCTEATNNCINQCNGLNNIKTFNCQNGVITEICECNDTSLSILNGNNQNVTPPGGLNQNPSSTPSVGDTTDQLSSKIVLNTDSINKTLTQGFNLLHSDIQSQQNKDEGIPPEVPSILQSDYNTEFENMPSDSVFSDYGNIDSTIISYVTDSLFTAQQITSVNPVSFVEGTIMNQNIKIDFSFFEEWFDWAGNLLYSLCCFSALFTAFKKS